MDDLSVCKGTVRRDKREGKRKAHGIGSSVLLSSDKSGHQTKVGEIINLLFYVLHRARDGLFYLDFIFKKCPGSSLFSISTQHKFYSLATEWRSVN